MSFEIDDYFGRIRTDFASDAELHQLARNIPRPAEADVCCALGKWQFVRIASVGENPGFTAPEIVMLGFRLDNYRFRITTPVVAIDFDSGLVQTESGSLYQLVGDPAMQSEVLLRHVAMYYARPMNHLM